MAKTTEVKIDKGDSLKITLEGLEGYPMEFTHDELVSANAQRMAMDLQRKLMEKQQAIHQTVVNAANSQQEMAGPTVGPLNKLN